MCATLTRQRNESPLAGTRIASCVTPPPFFQGAATNDDRRMICSGEFGTPAFYRQGSVRRAPAAADAPIALLAGCGRGTLFFVAPRRTSAILVMAVLALASTGIALGKGQSRSISGQKSRSPAGLRGGACAGRRGHGDRVPGLAGASSSLPWTWMFLIGFGLDQHAHSYARPTHGLQR